jgi:hypothetical protein
MTVSMLRRTLAPLLAAAILTPLALAAKERPLLELTDPRGDDHGGGDLLYPDNSDYARGELDLLALRATRGSGGTWFTAEFARPVRQPERRAIDQLGTQLTDVARNGFYTFNIDIYIDVDRKPGSGGTRMLPGRRAEVAPEFAWDRGVVLTPRPFYARGELKRSMMRALKNELKKQSSRYTESEAQAMMIAVPDDVERRVFFPSQTRVRGREIEFFVPDDFLGGPPSPDWAYVVIVTAADLQQSEDLVGKLGFGDPKEERLLILPMAPGHPREVLGGGREDDNMGPPVVDLIAPPGTTQERLLGDYSVRDQRPVALPGVVPSQPAPAASAPPSPPPSTAPPGGKR